MPQRKSPSGTHEIPQPPLPPEDPTLINLSQMVEKPGPLMKWLGKMFFGKVNVPDDIQQTIENAGAMGVPIFILHSRSALDYFYLNYLFLNLGLPLVFFANGINNLLFRPIGEVLKWLWHRVFGPIKKRITDEDLIRYGVIREKPITIFLKKPKTLLQWGGDYSTTHLVSLVKIQRELNKRLVLLPTVLIWHPTPGQYKKSPLDLILGDPDAPGRIRKFISFVRNFRRAFLRIGHAVDLKALIAGMEDASDEEIAAKIKFLMHEEFRMTSKAIKGPLLKRRKVIVNEMMKNPDFIKGVQAAKPGNPEAAVKKARHLVWKMAADFSINYIEAFALFLAVIWNRLFAGISIDKEGLRQIREAARSAPIAIMPSHRSHGDYLLISSLFYFNGLIAPHIAAGDNLNFWPVGHLFRRCGAFFIRRHFKGDSLYTHVAYSYLRKLFKEGYWVEFFLEGTRSRTGKMVTPRTGMLSMICKAVATGAAPDVWLLPSSVTYERVMEGKTYTKEAGGKEKKKEGFKDVVKTAKVLKTRYGRVYIQFDAPVSCRRYMETSGVKLPIREDEEVDPQVVKRLAYFMSYRIMKTIVVTPQNLVAFVLLTSQQNKLTDEMLLRRVGYVTEILSQHDRRFSDLILKPMSEYGLASAPDGPHADGSRKLIAQDDEALLPEAIGDILHNVVEEALKTFKAEEAIVVETSQSGVQSISPIMEKRLLLDMYKNGIINEFLPEAILSAGYIYLYNKARIRVEDLREESRFLSRLFKMEFIYDPTKGFDELFDQSLQIMIDEEIFGLSGDMLHLKNDGDDVLFYFAGIIGNFFEAYYTLIETLERINEPLSTKDLLKKTLTNAWGKLANNQIVFPESISMNYYKAAILWLTDEGYCSRSEDRARVVKILERERLGELKKHLYKYMTKVVYLWRKRDRNRIE